jgi:glycosyltransferase involved in cell wall biosynthesis
MEHPSGVLWYAKRFRQSIARTALLSVGIPAYAVTAQYALATELTRKARQCGADLFVGHYVAGLAAAAKAAAACGASYGFDAEDYHLGDLPDDPVYEGERRIIHAVERDNLPGAHCVTAASPLIAEAYARTYGIRLPITILNVFPRIHAPRWSDVLVRQRTGATVYWFSQSIGPDRGLELALKAIARSRSRPRLCLRGNPQGDYLSTLFALADSLKVRNLLHVLPVCNPDELERQGGQYDVGFCGETFHTLNRQIALTNKVFSYITSGLPVLGSNVPSHIRLQKEMGSVLALFPSEDPYALGVAMDELFDDDKALISRKKAAFDLGQTRYCWEVEAPRLVAALTQAAATV